MNLKIEYLFALFAVLFVILATNPQKVNHVYNSILGRLILIGVVIFFTMNNTTLGLLVALTIISASNQFGFFNFREGMESSTTIGEDNIPLTGKQQVLTNSTGESKKRISDLKADISDGTTSTNTSNTTNTTDATNTTNTTEPEGVDKEDIKNAIMAKDSKTIPVTIGSSEDVSAHKPSMLNSAPSLTESFCPFAFNL